MLSIFLLLLLLISFFVGFRRGFVLQVLHLAGVIASFIIAYTYYGTLAEYLRLWIHFPRFAGDSTFSLLTAGFDLEAVYYNGIAFFLIFFVSKIIFQVIATMFDFLANLPILHFMNGILGAVLGFVEMLLVIVVLLHVAALVQIEVVQSILQQSSVAQLIFDYTPILSDKLKEWWIEGRS